MQAYCNNVISQVRLCPLKFLEDPSSSPVKHLFSVVQKENLAAVEVFLKITSGEGFIASRQGKQGAEGN